MTQYRLTVQGTFVSGRTWSFRQHYSSGSTTTIITGDWQTAWTAAWTTIANPLQVIYPTTTVVTEFSGAALNGVPYREGEKVVNSVTIPGTSVNDGLPDTDAILISRRTALVGGRNRGRTYLPAPDESLAVGSELTALVAGHITTAINGVRAYMNAAGHTPVIYNTKASLIDPIIQSNKTIVSEKTDRIIRNQRRRDRKLAAVYV